MRRQQKELLNNLTIFMVSFMFAIVAIAISNPFSFKTADDTQLLYQKFIGEKTEVQGAFSENQFCPKDKPVIGWIDFQGNKKIVDNLEPEQTASSCFENEQKANSDGFTR